MSRCVSPSEELIPAVMAARLTGGLFTPERYHYLEATDSTNLQALALARAGAAEGTVVVANGQSRGRGRLGRSWESPIGAHLYVSVVLRPPMPVVRAPALTLLAGVALHDAVSGMGLGAARLKWPNDLLVHGRKLAGILTEMAAEGERIRHVVVGIGVNVQGRADELSPEVAQRAVTMAEILQYRSDRGLLLAALLADLDAWYRRFVSEGFEPIRRAWLERADLVGRAARFETASGAQAVWLEDLDADGFLLARDAHGERVRLVAGDVVLTG